MGTPSGSDYILLKNITNDTKNPQNNRIQTLKLKAILGSSDKTPYGEIQLPTWFGVQISPSQRTQLSTSRGIDQTRVLLTSYIVTKINKFDILKELQKFKIESYENVDQVNQIKVDNYAILAKAITTINDLFIEFSLGNFKEVSDILTIEKYSELAVLLHHLRNKSNIEDEDYEIIYKTIIHSLEGLMQGVCQYLDILKLKSDLDTAIKYAELLKDVKKLEEYIYSITHKPVFKDTTIKVITAKLKAEYVEYIRLYGYPINHVFCMDKLAICIENVSSDNSSRSSMSSPKTPNI
jgi:hypothetical protein